MFIVALFTDDSVEHYSAGGAAESIVAAVLLDCVPLFTTLHVMSLWLGRVLREVIKMIHIFSLYTYTYIYTVYIDFDTKG